MQKPFAGTESSPAHLPVGAAPLGENHLSSEVAREVRGLIGVLASLCLANDLSPPNNLMRELPAPSLNTMIVY